MGNLILLHLHIEFLKFLFRHVPVAFKVVLGLIEGGIKFLSGLFIRTVLQRFLPFGLKFPDLPLIEVKLPRGDFHLFSHGMIDGGGVVVVGKVVRFDDLERHIRLEPLFQ